MKNLIIPVILFTGMSLSAFAQEKSRKELRGDKYAFSYSYDKAIESYTKVKTLTTEGQRNLAVSYAKTGKFVEAESAYSQLMKASGGILAEDHYSYAMILKMNGKYEESNNHMDMFADLKPGDLRVKSYAANKNGLNDLLKDDGRYKTENLEVNTDAEDFGPSYYKNSIVFASTRAVSAMIKRKYNLNGKPFLNMYVSETDNGQLKKPEKFNKHFDTKMHDGPASFAKDGTYMAFTSNDAETKRKEKIVRLQICFANFANGKWSEPEPFILNSKGYSVGHPCLSADGNTMIFASDMPGGFGGADLYRIKKDEKGTWGKAENLGNKINTEGDELFPFYEENNEVLFFTSNGHFGLGGQDIFICPMNGTTSGKVYNAGSPLNTRSDDFAVVADKNLSKGYFSSNRSGGQGDDDIYSVEFLKGLNIGKKIMGIAKDKNESPVPMTFITLSDDKGKVIDTVTTRANAAYTFYVEADRNFKLTGAKPAYTEGINVANTFGKEFAVKADVTLLQKEIIVPVNVPVGSDVGLLLAFKPIYFDLDKYSIRPDAEVELNKIVKLMNEFPEMVVELGAHTDCRETAAYNQKLSERRAKSSADYIKKRISNPGRISGKGFGKSKLVNGCTCEGENVSPCSAEEHQKNRRTEFILIKK